MSVYRIISLAILGISLSLFSLSSAAQSKTYQVGISTWTDYPESVSGFKNAMTAAGLIAGRNVTYLQRSSNINSQRQVEIAEEFKHKKVDLVYSLTTSGTTIIKKTLSANTPIVFSIVTYPADSGLIESFEYSGNNLVGTSNFIPYQHYVDLLLALLPATKTVAIVHRKGEANSNIQYHNLRRLLRRQGINSINLEPNNIEQLKQLARQQAATVDLFITTTDTLIQGGGELALIKIAKQFNKPILSSNKTGIEAGASFGPVADFYQLGEISGNKAAKILLQQIQPTQLQSELQPRPLILVNKSALNRLKIKLPENLSNYRYTQ